jgi:hypothetical protein
MPRNLLFLCAIGAGSIAFPAAEKPRIFITESGVTEITAENLEVRKGVSSENIEVLKSFLKQCPEIAVTRSRDKADYTVRFDRETPSPITPFVKGNKVAVFDRNDDLIYSESSRYLSGVVKGTCSALLKDASSKTSQPAKLGKAQ